MLATIVQESWDAAGHEDAFAWLDVVGQLAALALVVVVVALVTRAVLRRHQYRATDVLTDGDLARLHEAIRAAEEETVGEVLPVVLERSDRHPGAPWFAATTFVLVGTAMLGAWLPWHEPALVLLAQVALGALGYVVACALPDFQRLFLSERRATEMAEEQAHIEFFKNGLHETEGRTGVLLFVSLLEHRVVVLADEGIASRVEPAVWQAADEAILKGIVAGSLASGLVAGIEEVGRVLAEHFPCGEGDRNEIPDRLVVRRE